MCRLLLGATDIDRRSCILEPCFELILNAIQDLKFEWEVMDSDQALIFETGHCPATYLT